MGTVAGAEANDEGRCEESGVEKSNSSLSSPMQIADPVVYKLVRVEGDGRLVPATEDEVMEVEHFLVDEKIESPVIVDAANVGCMSNEESSSGKSQKESSEGPSHSENNTEADAKLSACLEETAPSLAASLDSSQISESQRIECSKPLNGPIESASSASFVCISSKPVSSASKGEICLDNLSIIELQDLFRATFGRKTTVKDKLWLKRRIAMGLTNSCDVLTTTFTIVNNKLVKDKDDRSLNTDGILTEGSDGETKNLGYETSPASDSSQMQNHRVFLGKRLGDVSVEFDCGSDDLSTEERAAKRVRKPTKRYIEELSKIESRDDSPKMISSARNAGQAQASPKSCTRPLGKIPLNERTIVTRLDSIGGTGVHVPYVSRIRRSRPRKNVTALMKFEPSGMGMGAKPVKEALSVRSLLPKSEHTDKDLKARPASEQTKPLFTDEPEKDKCRPVLGTIELGKNMDLKQADLSNDNSDHGIAQVLTVKGGIRRKHHRAWTLVEVTKLVEGVARYGTGRWSEIKRLSSASFEYRTSVDLKDKWRNLLKASSAQPLPDDAINARKNASVPIPASILLKVRELAQMHAQVPPNLGPSKLSSVSRTLQQTRSGFL